MIECREWDAWRTTDGGEHALHVVATCSVPSSQVELELQLGDVGIIPEPELVALELHATEPGDDAPARRARKKVRWEGPISHKVRRVRIQGRARTLIQVRLQP